MPRLRFASLLALLLALAGPAAASDAPFAAASLSIGTSWYPEQWPEERWEADLALMERAHFRVVRLGEFAWARMEPADGQFDFAWLDRAIAAAERHGLKVVLGTPTAAPPIWLTEAHPDTLRMDEDGRVQPHGGRQQGSGASATYRRYAVRIARAMAQRYGNNPAVVGWQIDNELGVETFDRDASARWHQWLADRYGTVDALNRRWSTEYWSQRYQRFDQVRLTLDRDQNPALVLDAHRFFTSTWASYVAEQVAAIRAHADPRQFVTTNSTLWNDRYDAYPVHASLDLASWDAYVPNGRPDWMALALHHAVVRGFKRRNFWVMEAQPGWVNWGANNRTLDPGQTRELAWQAVAHGADAVLYWQWRSAPGGQEQYHGTLVGADGTPMPVYPEIARTAAEFARIGPLLAGTAPQAEIAMLYSRDSRWAIEQQRFARDYDPVAVMKDWYRPLFAAGQPIDVLPPDADLSRYRLVLAPWLNVLDGATAAALERYVRGGGQLILGPRSGMKDGDNALWPMRQPGPLAGLLGAHVEAFYALDETAPVIGAVTGIARSWAETLAVDRSDVEVIARYAAGGWLAGKPAIVTRAIGRGRVTYVGALLDVDGQAALARMLVRDVPTAAPADGIERAIRQDGERRILIAINHADHPAPFAVPPRARLVLGDLSEGQIAGHGIAVIALAENHGPSESSK
ncbi:cellulase family glycosylhydrolase [Erythrobacter sp. 3-20A1M]|uniref:beta-galactosidase n=1 Tax=Erythrobacter sp. 3-20A1M TaxID=2653850 RepID=UPI001BFC397F|nr:beta-galactosidase [Erythrobacter sp. 3-20A1M]QWC57464.1 cellulase family glycosylhydrolase [Erythrobacter sp. 3-20A1M]